MELFEAYDDDFQENINNIRTKLQTLGKESNGEQ